MIASLEPGGTELGNEPKGVVLDTTPLALTNFILLSCVLNNMINICHMLFILLSSPQRRERVYWAYFFP